MSSMRTQMDKSKLEASVYTMLESVINIRTVVGLGAEDRFYNNYTRLLLGPFKCVYTCSVCGEIGSCVVGGMISDMGVWIWGLQ